jgi:hypothetical protein
VNRCKPRPSSHECENVQRPTEPITLRRILAGAPSSRSSMRATARCQESRCAHGGPTEEAEIGRESIWAGRGRILQLPQIIEEMRSSPCPHHLLVNREDPTTVHECHWTSRDHMDSSALPTRQAWVVGVGGHTMVPCHDRVAVHHCKCPQWAHDHVCQGQ